MTVHVLRTISDQEAVAPEWRILFLADAHATPFQHPAWLLPWAQHLMEGDLCTIVVRDDAGVLVGLLPAYLYRQPTSSRRDLLLLGAGTSDYLGGVFRGSAAAELGLASLLAEPAWDYADLHQLRDDAPLLAAVQRRGVAITESEPCAVAATDPASRPSKLRLNINRYRHRAEARGALRLSTATTPCEALAYLEALIDLHTRRWHTRGEAGVLADAVIQQQHRVAVPLLLAAGLLRMVALYLDRPADPASPPIAILYGLLDPPRAASTLPRRFYGYLIGIDPAFADLSPGTLLLAALFEQCASDGLALFDMLRGGEAYKRLWGALPQPTFAARGPRP